MTRSKAIDHWSWLLLILLVLFLGFGVSSRLSPEKQAGVPKQRPAKRAPSSPVSKSPPEDFAVLQDEEPKVHRTGSSFRARLRPGETAVMGYHEIAPGKLGLSMVTLEARADGADLAIGEGGTLGLQIQTFEMPDSISLRTHAQEALPDIFELEKTGVISKERRNELLRFMLKDETVKAVSSPRIAISPGMPCIIRSGVTDPAVGFSGISYAVQTNSILDAEGFDLSVDFEHSGTRSTN